jgi:hypothetical protein
VSPCRGYNHGHSHPSSRTDMILRKIYCCFWFTNDTRAERHVVLANTYNSSVDLTIRCFLDFVHMALVPIAPSLLRTI